MKKIGKFFIGVKKEMKKVRWPNKKEMATYSFATISLVIVFMIYFTGIDVIIASLKSLIG